MTIDEDSAPDRFTAALSFITKGRAVGFPGFSLVVLDGTLSIGVDYPDATPNDTAARNLIATAFHNLDFLLASQPDYHATLSLLPRCTVLVRSSGNGEVEVAKVLSDRIDWHIPVI